MDIIGGLSAAKIAIDIVKDLRSIDRSLDEATYKLKLADLMTALADAQIALSEAKLAFSEQSEKIQTLERKLETALSGEACPICRQGNLNVTAVRSHPVMGDAGLQERDLECSNESCRHRERRIHDPMGLLKK